MNYRIGRSASTLILLLTLTAQLNVGQVAVQEPQPAKKFAVLGYSPWPVACHPVLVNAVASNLRTPEVLTPQVTIVSHSAKPVIAVKLKWHAYKWDVAMKKRKSGCDDKMDSAETFLSGTTPLIHLGQLAEKETCNISTNPLVIKSRATKTVFVDQPIIMWDEVKSLTSDGTRGSFKDDYAVIIYVSEIHFADGSQWTGEIK